MEPAEPRPALRTIVLGKVGEVPFKTTVLSRSVEDARWIVANQYADWETYECRGRRGLAPTIK